MTTDIKELVKRLRAWNRDVLGADGTFGVAADAIEALAGEVERLKRMLFPYAEDKEISGVTWNGFYLIGNRKSVDEFKRLENRAAQLEVYRAEFVRRNEAAEAERDRLKAALETIAEEHDAGRHDGLPEPCPAHDADTMFYVARKALGDAS